ncbi:MAG: hypothetical protein ABSB35_00195 [Bryobacteraceae bacterium]|jgi:hypothetical protein
MRRQSCRSFLTGAAALTIFAGCALAANHHELNGTWQLIPSRSEFHEEPVIESGTITINDRESNIYVSRNFTYQGANQSTTSSFSTDSRENTIIKNPGVTSKSKWEGGVLKVTTTREGITTVERYSLRGDGSMVLMIDRPRRALETLVFQRQ